MKMPVAPGDDAAAGGVGAPMLPEPVTFASSIASAPPSAFPRRFASTQRFTLGAPRSIRVAADDSRIVFSRSTAGDDPVNCLWVLDLDSGLERLVADPVALLSGADQNLTDAEKARRERAREAGGGITTWVGNANLTTAVFALNGLLFRTDLDSGETVQLDAAAGAFDPRISPSGALVAYVAGNNLHVLGPNGDRVVADSRHANVTWGMAEFVAAEEMGRGRGHWWGPSDDHLMAARVDVSDVAEWTISSPVEPWKPARTMRYPAAGETNAKVELAILSRDGTALRIDWAAGDSDDNGSDKGKGEPTFEYLAHVSWGSREQPTLAVQTRDQRTTAVLTVDPLTGVVTERYRWTDPHWTELITGSPAWFGEKLVTVEDRGEARRLVVDGVAITNDVLQVMSIVRVNVSAATAIVGATADSSENHIWSIDLRSGEATPWTSEPGVHSIASGGSVSVISSATLNHFGLKARIRAPGRGDVDGRAIISLAEQPDVMPTPRIMRAGSLDLRTALLLPADLKSNPRTLPVLLDPYGGPHARRVLRSRNAFLTSQWFADQGFAVIVTDGRGTPARGPAFEREVYGDLAAPVLEDQITALHAISTVADLDLTRVGIRGWSFGGYLAALAVLRAPDVFHAAIAGAPVTDWRLYDTHYTERYLGHPDEVPTHYDRTDLCAEAASLTRPLMLIHGLADDNVVAAHTLALSRALLETGRPHQVLPLSGVTHMTPQAAVAENLLRLQLAFLKKELDIQD